MSFPRLVISGDNSTFTITNIELEYDNDLGPSKPAKLTRSRYDIKRQFRNESVSTGTKLKSQNMPYDQARSIRQWTGYVDVMTESVTIHPASTEVEIQTVDLIRESYILNMGYGPEHTVKYLQSEDLGPGKPSLGGSYVDAFSRGGSWVYDTTFEKVESSTTLWAIKEISIVQNVNSTSRVTFIFENVGAWINLKTAIFDKIPGHA